ncbi:Hypothetical predicted protein [Pelobates cultripes]|uniref:Uncharacterized protein n=1 Tax=Pelobates cultripes TaxID=61616 RepID=A0AAD1SKD4_PELCU|nr:Hypothetical predicted protein [Pelobates cultripes]
MEVRQWVEKRPRQRLDSSNSLDSDILEPSGEFKILDLVDSCESEGEMLSEYLDSESVEKLILMVRRTLEISEDTHTVEGSVKHVADLHKQKLSFPLYRAIKEKVTSKWKRPEKRLLFQGKLAKFYPLEEDTSRMWITPPKVDAPISRVARKVMLPLDSTASLREPMDRMLDIHLF